MRSCRVPREERRGKEGEREGWRNVRGGKFSRGRERSPLARVWSAYRKDNETRKEFPRRRRRRRVSMVMQVMVYVDWRTTRGAATPRRGVWWLCALRLFPR